MKIKIEWIRKKKENVSFLDMDGVLHPNTYARDGVYLNTAGHDRMGRRLREWVKALSVLIHVDEK